MFGNRDGQTKIIFRLGTRNLIKGFELSFRQRCMEVEGERAVHTDAFGIFGNGKREREGGGGGGGAFEVGWDGRM